MEDFVVPCARTSLMIGRLPEAPTPLPRLPRDARHARPPPLPGERFEVVQAPHARLLVQRLCGLRPDTRDPEDVEQPRRDLLLQVLGQVDPPRHEKLPDLSDEVRPD